MDSVFNTYQLYTHVSGRFTHNYTNISSVRLFTLLREVSGALLTDTLSCTIRLIPESFNDGHSPNVTEKRVALLLLYFKFHNDVDNRNNFTLKFQ
jgi:hypothetical protein